VKEHEEIFTVEEIANYLRIKPLTVYRWIKQNRIPFIKLGRRNFRFRRTVIDQWLKDHEGGAKK
jgi:excisionase family DNA binding protein